MNSKLALFITICSSILLGLGIGYIFGKSITYGIIKESKHDVEFKSEHLKNKSLTFDLRKGGVYLKKFNFDYDDPFSKTMTDTITILDFKTSPRNPDLIYAKWTFNRWKDSTKYISSDVKFLSQDIEEIK